MNAVNLFFCEKRMKSKLWLLSALLFSAGQLKAGLGTNTDTLVNSINSSSFSYVVELGSNGIGLHYGLKISQSFTVRTGFSFLQINDIDWQPNNTSLATKGKLTSLQLMALLEFQAKKTDKFKWTLGVSHFDNLSLIGYNDYNFANQAYNSCVEVSYYGLTPYIGLGFGQLVPTKAIGYSVNIGVYYIGKPSINVSDQSKSVFSDYKEVQSFRTRLSRYTIYPHISISLSLRP